jgi:predicted ribosome quality control (RQC) complex YloA/Tae2 family protein
LFMQKQLSSFDIYVIVNELQSFIGSYIDKIYHLTRDELLIRVKKENKDKINLFIRNGELICVTEKELKTPQKPSTFAMTLRKYLLNGKITNVAQHEFDRIIKLKIGKKEGEYTLVFEFFSKGNIILVDPDGNIILPLIKESWAHRKIKGRQPYIPPPAQLNSFELSFEEFKKRLKESTSDIVRTLAVTINLSGPIAEEVCIRAGVDKKIKIESIGDDAIAKIFDVLNEFIQTYKAKKFEPVVVEKDTVVVDVLPFKFETHKDFDFEKIESLSKGLEVFIEKRTPEKKVDSKIDKMIGRLERQLTQQLEAVEKLNKEIDQKKLEGDLIYLNYQEIDNLLKEIDGVLDLKEKKEEIEEINKKSIVKEFSPTDNLLIVFLKDTSGEIFEVKLSFRKTVSENAEKAYADNKKLRSKLNGAQKSIIKTKQQIEEVKKKQVLEEEKQERKPVKKEKLFWFERFRWFISSEGNIVIGGKDAKTNEFVVKKYLKEKDRYAHADISGAPSIIIKSKGVNDEELPISDETLEEACVFAASFSKAWKQFAEAQAYWVNPEQVSKTAQSGEFVPHGAFIIRGKRNYHRCKLEVAIGEMKIDDERKIMCGPVSSLKNHSKKYVVLEPGNIKKSDIAKKIANVFDVNIENVDRVLPPGGVSVVEAVGVKL